MSEAPEGLSRRELREAYREVRGLLKRGGKRLPESLRESIRTEVDAFRAALDAKDDERARACAREALSLADAHLGFARKSRLREYTESIGLAVLIALFLRAFILEPFQIPSGSMRPTLLEGDRLFVVKFSHGIRIPMTERYLVRWSDPEPGDVVVFVYPAQEILTQLRMRSLLQSVERYREVRGSLPVDLASLGLPSRAAELGGDPLRDAWGTPFRFSTEGDEVRLVSAGRDRRFDTADDFSSASFFARVGDGGCLSTEDLGVGKDYIKRIVAGPGDTVEMRDNQLWINGEPVSREGIHEASVVTRHGMTTREVATESIDGERAWQTQSIGIRPSFPAWTVREGHFFVVGDNRDDSADSRCWGEVPIENIKGSALFIFYSHDSWGREGVRWSRTFQRIR